MMLRPLAAAFFTLFATLGAAATPASSTVAASDGTLYRVELSGGRTVFASGTPRANAAWLLFRQYPGGVLMSVKRSEVRRVSPVAREAAPLSDLKPGEQRDLGAIGAAVRSAARGATPPANGTNAGSKEELLPGEGKGGTALFNPDRSYRPDWDGKLVPGATIPRPNSPNDYKEGVTLAHPAAPAVQAAPGDVPKAPN